MTSFLIRRISVTADGREIIRDLPSTGDIVTVGRSPASEISLPDLALDQDHATIASGNDGLVHVESVGRNSFQIDGRNKKQASIAPGDGIVIGLGGHSITVSQDHSDGGSGQTILTVQRVDGISRSSEEIDQARAFSLRGLMLGKRGTAWLLAASVLIGFLAIPIYGYFQRQAADHRSIYSVHADKSWSSGPLSAAHHQLEGKCEACHVKAFVSVRDETCQSCHKATHDHAPMARINQARIAPDFGGRVLASVAHAFGKEGAGSCVDCHTEHEGAGPMQPTKQAFCSDCHGSLKARLPDTKLGNAGDFGTSHPQFQPIVTKTPGARPVLVRASLDTHPTDDSGLKFTHKMHLDKLGGVAQMARTLRGSKGYGDSLVCSDCHKPTADRTRFLPVDMEKDCQACHSLAFDKAGGTVRTLRHGNTAQMMAELRGYYREGGPVRTAAATTGITRHRPGSYAEGQVYSVRTFGGGLGAENAIRAVFSPGGACYDCHVITPPGASATGQWDVTLVHQRARYMMKGWFDHDAHKAEKCVSCHAAERSTQATDLLLPDLKSCRTCHGGEASNAKVPSSCAMCHSYHVKKGAPWKGRKKPLPATTVAANRSSGFAAQE